MVGPGSFLGPVGVFNFALAPILSPFHHLSECTFWMFLPLLKGVWLHVRGNAMSLMETEDL